MSRVFAVIVPSPLICMMTVIALDLSISMGATVSHRSDLMALSAIFFLSQLAVVIPVLEWSHRRLAPSATAHS